MMESLPPEVVAMVTQYLSMKDLASCCTVSLLWREVFGCDEVWRPLCDVDSEEYLRTTPCRVEPKFTSPEFENSTMSPIGRWRTAYMREKHLWKNWIRGNCVKDEISNSCRQIVFLNNDFVITVSEDVIRITDTTVTPPVCVAELTILGSTGCEVSVVRSDTFIIWDKENTVQVIEVDWEAHALSVKHIFCASEGKHILKYDIVNTTFVGLDNNLLHIWDLERAAKLKTESWSDNFQWINVGHDKKCENLYVIGIQRFFRDSDVRWYLHIYNVKELRFWPFTRDSSTKICSCAIVEQYLALVIDYFRIEVFNYRTLQRLHTVKACHFNVCTVGNSFMFITENRDLVQLSPSTGAVTRLHSNICIFMCFSEELFTVYPFEEQQLQLWKITPKLTVKLVMLFSSNMFSKQIAATNQSYSKASQLDWDESPLRGGLFTFW